MRHLDHDNGPTIGVQERLDAWQQLIVPHINSIQELGVIGAQAKFAAPGHLATLMPQMTARQYMQPCRGAWNALISSGKLLGLLKGRGKRLGAQS